MCFDGWCVYRVDRVRRDLDALMTELLRTRLAREHAAGIHRAYDQVAESVAYTVPLAPPPRRACVNHPDRWAQEGGVVPRV